MLSVGDLVTVVADDLIQMGFRAGVITDHYSGEYDWTMVSEVDGEDSMIQIMENEVRRV